MIVEWPKFNNDRYPWALDKSILPEGWTSHCSIYTLVRRRHDGHVFRFWNGVDRTGPIPDGYEEFFTQDPRPYMCMQRLRDYEDAIGRGAKEV